MSFMFYSPPFQVYTELLPRPRSSISSDSDSESDPVVAYSAQEQQYGWHYDWSAYPSAATLYPWEPVIKQSTSTSSNNLAYESSNVLDAQQIDLLRAYVNTPQQQQQQQQQHQQQPDACGACFSSSLQSSFNPHCHVVSPTQTYNHAPPLPQVTADAASTTKSSPATSLSSSAEEEAHANKINKSKASGRSRRTRHKTAGRQGINTGSGDAATVHRPFKCPGCDMVFKRQEHVKRHYRSIHTQDKPFECPVEYCAKRFARTDNLAQHMRIHQRK